MASESALRTGDWIQLSCHTSVTGLLSGQSFGSDTCSLETLGTGQEAMANPLEMSMSMSMAGYASRSRLRARKSTRTHSTRDLSLNRLRRNSPAAMLADPTAPSSADTAPDGTDISELPTKDLSGCVFQVVAAVSARSLPQMSQSTHAQKASRKTVLYGHAVQVRCPLPPPLAPPLYPPQQVCNCVLKKCAGFKGVLFLVSVVSFCFRFVVLLRMPHPSVSSSSLTHLDSHTVTQSHNYTHTHRHIHTHTYTHAHTHTRPRSLTLAHSLAHSLAHTFFFLNLRVATLQLMHVASQRLLACMHTGNEHLGTAGHGLGALLFVAAVP